MKVLQVFGFVIVLWQSRSDGFSMIDAQEDVVIRGCKNLESTSPLLRLKKHLFCDYDSTVRPSHHKIATNVTMRLMPKLMELRSDNAIFTLHSWLTLTWTDTHLTWTPSDYEGINFIHVKSYEIWLPDLFVYNSGDMTHDQNDMPLTECLLFNSGIINCVPAVKYISKCEPDYSYWPYDKHKCRILLGSWSYTGEEIDFQLGGKGIQMDGYENNSVWDFKFISAEKDVKRYKCCPNDTFPRITYVFLISRHHGVKSMSNITPAIALVLLTLTVLWLDSRSVERVAMASVNFICHLLCLFNLHWQLPYNGVNPPKILLFYRESLALATFALILTALLRKLQDMSMEIPNWILSTTTLVLNNRAGRFLILNNEESKTVDGSVAEENMDMPKPEIRTKESSWRHFASIIEWLSFFCVILTYIVILITLIPTL